MRLDIELDRELEADLQVAMCHRMERIIASIGDTSDLDESVRRAAVLIETYKAYKTIEGIEHNECANCGKDIGASLWGWCSIECLTALVPQASVE